MHCEKTNSEFWNAMLGVLLCGSLAVALCLLFGDVPTKLTVPLMFLLVIIPVAAFWGKNAAVLGSVMASLTFALLLFPPLHSVRVEDHADRLALISFQAIAIGVACILDRLLVAADDQRE